MRINLFRGKMPEPQSLQWALTRHKQLVFEIKKVERQLGDVSRAKGKSEVEYERWRLSAMHVATLLRLEEGQLSAWIETNNEDTNTLFHRAYTLLKELEIDVDFEPHETELMRLLDIHFEVNAITQEKKEG